MGKSLLFTVENYFQQKLKHKSQLSKAEKMFAPKDGPAKLSEALRDCL